jgi:hypothetical protein
MYGASFCAWRRKSIVNASDAQRPLAFMTSMGIPRSRYSRVDPMRMPWTCMKSMSAALNAAVKRFLKAVFVSGCLLVLWRYEKRARVGEGELIDK